MDEGVVVIGVVVESVFAGGKKGSLKVLTETVEGVVMVVEKVVAEAGEAAVEGNETPGLETMVVAGAPALLPVWPFQFTPY